ncbi:MAG: hypothetical protein M1830_001231 [Pleopsidium flavum]|nr:MAG: hypothetical protein M1830_001231 [Pleopsidium flavum]
MGLYTEPPFALFCLTDLPTINQRLREAYDGSTVEEWYFWADGYPADGTEAPVDSFKSPFVGEKVEDVGEFLRKAPDAVDLDRHFFAVLDDTEQKGSITLRRIGDRQLKGDKVECLPVVANDSSLHLAGMESGTWEEHMHSYNRYNKDKGESL